MFRWIGANYFLQGKSLLSFHCTQRFLFFSRQNKRSFTWSQSLCRGTLPCFTVFTPTPVPSFLAHLSLFLCWCWLPCPCGVLTSHYLMSSCQLEAMTASKLHLPFPFCLFRPVGFTSPLWKLISS